MFTGAQSLDAGSSKRATVLTSMLSRSGAPGGDVGSAKALCRLKVVGAPIRFEFKSGENPFATKVDRLTPRQKVKKDNDLKKGRRIKKTRQKSVKR